MPLDVYLAVGHGVQPNGIFDPGAVAADGTQEHTLATAVTATAAAALLKAGVSLVWEANAGAGHDPDYRGSVNQVNAVNPKIAVEVHFDANNAPRGGFGIYLGDAGKRLAAAITARFAAVGLATRTDYKDVRGLYFLKGTHMPALIYECDRTMAQSDPHMLVRMGEAVAGGICDYFGRVPASIPQGAPMQPDFRVHIIGDIVSAYTPPEGGIIQFTDAGYVYAWGNAAYQGGPAAAENITHWAAGNRVGTKIEASPVPGKKYRCWDTASEYYDFPL